jgi:hypothetical protein
MVTALAYILRAVFLGQSVRWAIFRVLFPVCRRLAWSIIG